MYDSLVYRLCNDSQLPIDRMASVSAGLFGESEKNCINARARQTTPPATQVIDGRVSSALVRIVGLQQAMMSIY